MITQFPRLAARPHDINHLEALGEDFSGAAPADKGFIWVNSPYNVALLGAILVCPLLFFRCYLQTYFGNPEHLPDLHL